LVEGFSPIDTEAEDGVGDTIGIREHLFCRNPQHFETLSD
jgi:hypothetical protein